MPPLPVQPPPQIQAEEKPKSIFENVTSQPVVPPNQRAGGDSEPLGGRCDPLRQAAARAAESPSATRAPADLADTAVE